MMAGWMTGWMPGFLAACLILAAWSPTSRAGEQAAAGPLAGKSAETGPRPSAEKARKLVELTRVADLMLESIKTRLEAMPIPAEAKDLYLRLATRESVVEMLAPIYQANLSEAEADALVKFYESPIGKSLSEKQFDIARQSSEAIQNWALELREKAMAEQQQAAGGKKEK